VTEPAVDRAVAILEAEEGFSAHAYYDSEGWLTIGIGCLIDTRKGGGITIDEARYLLRNRLAPIYVALDERLPWWREMTPDRRAVLVSLACQVGISGLLRFRRTLAAMEAGDYAGASKGLMASLWARQTPARAGRAEAAMRTGAWTAE